MPLVKVHTKDQVFSIELDREEKRNAFNPQMIEELTDAFIKVRKDPNAQILVLRGRGKSFCSGADLGWMQSMINYSYEENILDSNKLFKMFEALESVTIPVISYAQGHVMGGALGLLALSDYVFSDEHTKFGFTEARLGLVPAVISPFCLNRLSFSNAKKYMMSAEVFSAKTAEDIGLVDFVGRIDEIHLKIDELISHFKSLSPEAVRSTKFLLNSVYQVTDSKQKMDMTSKVISERRISEDAQVRLKNFLTKAK